MIDGDRKVHAGHVGGADEHACIGRDLAKETGVLIDVGFHIGVEIRLVDFRKAQATRQAKRFVRIINQLELETVARARADVAVLCGQQTGAADVSSHRAEIADDIGVVERVKKIRAVLRDRAVDFFRLVIGEIQVQPVLEEFHAQTVVRALRDSGLKLAAVDAHDAARGIEGLGKVDRRVEPICEMEHRTDRARDLAALNWGRIKVILETVVRVARVTVAVGRDAGANVGLLSGADGIAGRVALAIGETGIVGGGRRPENAIIAIPVEGIITFVELLAGAEIKGIVTHGPEHDEAVLEELRVDRA